MTHILLNPWMWGVGSHWKYGERGLLSQDSLTQPMENWRRAAAGHGERKRGESERSTILMGVGASVRKEKDT